MFISHLSIRNFKRFRHLELDLNPRLNIIVGDNNSGKTTVLEAIHLALTGDFRGRPLADCLTSYLFTKEVAEEFLAGVRNGVHPAPPEIRICVTICSNRGFKIEITCEVIPAETYLSLLYEAASDPACDELPVQFYTSRRYDSFGGCVVPLTSYLIDGDTSESCLLHGLLGNSVSIDDHLRLRRLNASLRSIVSSDDAVAELNALLSDSDTATPTGSRLGITAASAAPMQWSRLLSVSADGMPIASGGGGTRKSVATRLAAVCAAGRPASSVVMIEEPEEHLSFSSMQRHIAFLEKSVAGSQLILTTLSSYVANKLGLDSLTILSSDAHITLRDIDAETSGFFRRLAGYDTLRMILAKRCILVEGDSDELIVQKAYLQRYGRLPSDDGIDVVCVRGLAFRRYLALALPLRLHVSVVTDSDGAPDKVLQRFDSYVRQSEGRIKVFTPTEILSASDFSGKAPSDNFNYNTLEPHLLHCNTTRRFNLIFGTDFADASAMLHHMRLNKNACAHALFLTETTLHFPRYIEDAIAASGDN